MKVVLITITSVLIAIANCSAELTPEWEVDLFNMTGILGGGGNNSYSDKTPMRIYGQSDGGVILHYSVSHDGVNYTNNLFVLNSEGELSHSVTNLNIANWRPHVFTAHGNHIVLKSGSSNVEGDTIVLHIIEMQESGYSVTTSDYFSMSGNYRYEDRADTIFLFSEETQMLRKHRIPDGPAVLDSAIASGIDGPNYILNWKSTAGASYEIQSSTNLTDWISIGGPIIGTGSSLTWANALTNSPGYFRVITN